MRLRLLFVVLCAGLLGTAAARADDEWAVTGPLSTPRSGGTLTVAGGKGVLAGGRPSMYGALAPGRDAGTYVTALSGRVSVHDLRSADAVTLRAGASRLVPARR